MKSSLYYLSVILFNGEQKKFTKYYLTEDEYINKFNSDMERAINYLFLKYKKDNLESNLEPKNFFLSKFNKY